MRESLLSRHVTVSLSLSCARFVHRANSYARGVFRDSNNLRKNAILIGFITGLFIGALVRAAHECNVKYTLSLKVAINYFITKRLKHYRTLLSRKMTFLFITSEMLYPKSV